MSKEVENIMIGDIVNSLIEKAHKIIEWKFLESIGDKDSLPEGYFNYDHEKLGEFLVLVKPLLATGQQTKKIEAQTSQDIVKLIATGKINIEEAHKLLLMAKTKLDVEEKEAKAILQRKMLSMLDGADNE